VLTAHATSSTAQVTLQADGPGNTYALLSSVFGGSPYEVPDCGHPEFGPHITEEWNAELGRQVFVFHIHVNEDDDRCTNFDRQRNEIKTYGPSLSNVKGAFGEVHTYRWKFRLDAGFKPSPNFTHIFQIKAGDGSDDGAPIITITPRAGSPETLQIIFTPSSGTSGGGVKASANLSAFKGQWIEVYVRTLYTDTGTFEILLSKVSDGTPLLAWSSNNIDMWRAEATFNRPKWGIYRSLNSIAYLRDERVLFADFCIAEGASTCVSIPPMTRPHITSHAVNGSNLVLSGTNGVPGWAYYVLTSTNVARPLINWTRAATNVFRAAGDFAFTNNLGGSPQQYYLLLLAP